MTDCEHAAFRLGIRHAADLALVAAVTMESRDDARSAGPRAAMEALWGLADGLRADVWSVSPIPATPLSGLLWPS